MLRRFAHLLLLALVGFAHPVSSQTSFVMPDLLMVRQVDRVVTPVNEQQRVILAGNRHARAKMENDIGPAPPDLRMERMILVLRPDERQQSALNALTQAQQEPTSPYYHQWITPESYSLYFGISESDQRQVEAWLIRNGLQLEEMNLKGSAILFSGTVAQVEEAFHTRIDTYQSENELHHANATDLAIPAALSAVVDGVVSMHDFPLAPLHASLSDAVPNLTNSIPLTNSNPQGLTPADFAAISHLTPLYDMGINGAGVSIAVAGRTNIDLEDVRSFRSAFGLPGSEPEVVIDGLDPGRLGAAEEAEAVLGLEWTGAVARNALIKYVVSRSTNTTDGIFLAAQYIVNHDMAEVMSVNFGLCEAWLGASANTFLQRLWQQAAVQGISVVVPSGSNEARACDVSAGERDGVNGLSSTPYNVAIDMANADSVSTFGTYGDGASTIYSKPWWQYGENVPDDGRRDVPDVTLALGDQEAFQIYLNGFAQRTGGGSAMGASFAGIMALVAQNLGARQGNPAPVLYSLANRQRTGNTLPMLYDSGIMGDNADAGCRVIGLKSKDTYLDAYLLVTQWGNAGNAVSELELKSPPSQRPMPVEQNNKPPERSVVDARPATPVGANDCGGYDLTATNKDVGMTFNKNGWSGLVKRAALPLALLLGSLPVASQTQASVSKPVLFYSDIDSGPASGGEGKTDGAFVCVYGENFGTGQGKSALAVGGVQVASYKVWQDSGAPYRPGYYAKACGQVSHMTPSGAAALQLTTSQGASNTLPFTVRPGKVYFVAPTGDDRTGNGSSNLPWLTVKHCTSNMKPGDFCYLRAGTYNTIDKYGAALWMATSGGPGAPLSVVAYPGQTVNINNFLSGGGAAAIRDYNSTGPVDYWTLAGLTVNGSGMAIYISNANYFRIADNDLLCQGKYCYGADAGLTMGSPVAMQGNYSIFGNRIHDVGCHEGTPYSTDGITDASDNNATCAWVYSNAVTITTSSSAPASWTLSGFGGLYPGEVIGACVNGTLGGHDAAVTCTGTFELRKIASCNAVTIGGVVHPAAYCWAGTLDYPFTTNGSFTSTATAVSTTYHYRGASPPKLFHTVYMGNADHIWFGWNDVDGSEGHACRGVLFHSTNGHNEYDIHVFNNAIHDTVCDCLNFATVDPNQGTVEAYNNTMYNCGTGIGQTGSSYSAIYSPNANDDYAETMTRRGNIQVYNNTIYNAGAGAGVYNKACFAVMASGDITSTFPHSQLASALEPGNNVTAAITGLCGYGTACTGAHHPVPFRAGQMVVIDTRQNAEETSVVSVPDSSHIVLASITKLHASGVKLTGVNGNAGIAATNNICYQPGVKGTSYVSLLGFDEIARPAAAYFSGSNNNCSGLPGRCPEEMSRSVDGAPAFVAPKLHNFRLQLSTPLSAAGTGSKSPSTDQDGYPRSQKPTIGAFEVPRP